MERSCGHRWAYFRGTFAQPALVEGSLCSAVRRNDGESKRKRLRWQGAIWVLESCRAPKLRDELQKLVGRNRVYVFNQTDVYALLAALHTRRGKSKKRSRIEEAARRASKGQLQQRDDSEAPSARNLFRCGKCTV